MQVLSNATNASDTSGAYAGLPYGSHIIRRFSPVVLLQPLTKLTAGFHLHFESKKKKTCHHKSNQLSSKGKSGPNPPKVAIFLEEIGLPYEAVAIPLADVKKPDYLAINPWYLTSVMTVKHPDLQSRPSPSNSDPTSTHSQMRLQQNGTASNST